MKKSILFGALAFLAVSALGIQNANAQTKDVKEQPKKVATVSEKEKAPVATEVVQEPVKQKKGECCTDKKVSADKKKAGECCADKKASVEGKKPHACCDAKKEMKKEEVKQEMKKEEKPAVKPGKSED